QLGKRHACPLSPCSFCLLCAYTKEDSPSASSQHPPTALVKLKDMNKHEAEARLTAEHVATARRITSMTAELGAVSAAAVGSNLDDEHDPEGSTIAFEREQLAALRAHAQIHLIEVDDALARLHDNRDGHC